MSVIQPRSAPDSREPAQNSTDAAQVEEGLTKATALPDLGTTGPHQSPLAPAVQIDTTGPHQQE